LNRSRRLLALIAAMLLVGTLGVAGTVSAAVNSVTPSTNDINRANGWAHVDVTVGAGSATLTFITTRNFLSCFEVRTDGDTSEVLTENGGVNYNTDVHDGLYPYYCVRNSTMTATVSATSYVEVRMVFGAERDERFDWTRFDVLPKCTPTGFMRDGHNLTAYLVNPTSPVTGNVDATTCNIGVYFGPGHTGSVHDATVFGANYYGVVANAANVNVTDSTVRDIGESPLNGAQHGIGVFYTTINQDGSSTGSAATGTLSGSTITGYQKGGVVVSGPGAAVTVADNTVTGAGPVAFIAQNGIQVSYGATALVTGNTVSGNAYTPRAWVACGLLWYQADGVRANRNHVAGNEMNLCNVGKGGGQFNP
jgi:hypothetical protein